MLYADAGQSRQEGLLMAGNYNNKPSPHCRLESNRDDQRSVIPVKRLLFGGLAIMITKIICDFRPVTLRHQVSLVLPFGSRSILTTLNALVLDAGLCVAVFWRLCFYR